MRADHRWPIAGLLLTGLLAGSLAWAQEPAATEPRTETPAEEEVATADADTDKGSPSETLPTFDEVWQTVNDSYYDPDFGGLDWLAIREKYRPMAAEAAVADAGAPGAAEPEAAAIPRTVTRDQPKVGRNEPCPCGSGKKYKQCHGKL